MSDFYILDGRVPVPVATSREWAAWRLIADRRVAADKVGDVLVSTVFLGIDHNWAGVGPPILFETLVFGGPLGGAMERYSSWEHAEQGHAAMLALVRVAELPE